MVKAVRPHKREQGNIKELPSGALRVRVYAGQDPVTKRRHSLVETVPAGPPPWERADEIRRGFLADIRARRNPTTTATVDQLLDRYLEQHTGGRRTVEGYREYVNKHVRPFIGSAKLGSIDAEVPAADGSPRRAQRLAASRKGTVATYQPNPAHKRAKLLQVTPSGRAALERMQAAYAQCERRAVEGLDSETLQRTRRTLVDLQHRLEAELPGREGV